MQRIHHINLAVPSLTPIVERMTSVLNVAPREVEYLPARGVQLQRFELDGVWLVLVAPTNAESPVQHWLDAHGPGLFLLSFEVSALQDTLVRLDKEGIVAQGPERRGLDDWRVADLDPSAFLGIPLQLTETGRDVGTPASDKDKHGH